jgi:hypothetical protein
MRPATHPLPPGRTQKDIDAIMKALDEGGTAAKRTYMMAHCPADLGLQLEAHLPADPNDPHADQGGPNAHNVAAPEGGTAPSATPPAFLAPTPPAHA